MLIIIYRDTPPSYDMLVTRRSLLQSELDTLKSTINYTSKGHEKAQQATDTMKKRAEDASDKRDNATRVAIDARIACINKTSLNETDSAGGKDLCSQFEEAADSVVDATFQEARASSEYDSARFLLNSNETYQSFMQTKMNDLERKISEVESHLSNLGENQVFLGEIAESPAFQALDESERREFDDKWLKFDYNSESTHVNTEKETSSSYSGVNIGAVIPIKTSLFATVGVGTGHGKRNVAMKEAINRASIQVSGELLRVFIKRPWFKPSLFDNPTLSFVSTVTIAIALLVY